jgi:hypothetical protein
MPTEIISYHLKNVEYRTPVASYDANGEVQVRYADEKPHLIPSITVLFKVQMDDDGNVVEATGIDVANSYLMHLVVNREHQCISAQSRALVHFFHFLNEQGMKWDEMPIRQNRRPTYRFKGHLESLFHSKDPNSKLRGSTVQSYMRCVVNFYRYHIARRHPFDNPPFEHEIITVSTQVEASSMQSVRSRHVHTTDLRIKAAKSEEKKGIPNRLIALSKFEWAELDAVLRKERRIIRIDNRREVVGSLAVEFTWMFLLMRWSGLRREEAASFPASLVIKPTQEQIKSAYITFDVGKFCGMDTKFDKVREIEVPSYLMRNLHNYVTSKRCIHRRNLFEEQHPSEDLPLFLNNKGEKFALSTLNARWVEIRRMMVKRLGRKFNHKIHNLRPTYAVSRLNSLLDAGVDQSDALAFIGVHLGHEGLATTLHYLKQVQEKASGHEKAEHVYGYLFDLHEQDFELK